MTKYIYGDVEQDIAPENEAAFEAMGWQPVEPETDPEPDKKKSDK